jgi:hypothetical protein
MASTSAFDIGFAAGAVVAADGVDPVAAGEPAERDPKIADAMLPKMLMISLRAIRCRRSKSRSYASSISAMSIPSLERAYKDKRAHTRDLQSAKNGRRFSISGYRKYVADS